MTTYKLSPSSLNLMFECKRCFWLTQHKVWKRPASIFPSLPSGMDKILKIHFDKFRDREKIPPELKETECGNGFKLFENKELLEEWRNVFKGVRWTDEEGNIFFGGVDNILQKGDKLIVLDYKTRGYPVKEDTADHYQNQLDVYNLLLRKNGYETEDFAFLLFYVPKEVTETGEVIFDTELVKREIDVNNAEQIFSKALEVLNGECPEKGCEWCEKVESGR